MKIYIYMYIYTHTYRCVYNIQHIRTYVCKGSFLHWAYWGSMANNRLDRLASFLLDPGRDEPPEEVKDEPSSSQHKVPLAIGCTVQGMQATPNTWRWTVQQCDPSLLNIARLHEIMAKLHTASGNHFDLRLAKGKLASLVLQHCVAVVAALASQSHRFKIGITTDPFHRWFNSDFGYLHDGAYSSMTIIALVKSMEAASYLEAALIREFRDCGSCQNEARGGEGAAADAPLGFVYVVSLAKFGCKRPRHHG